jgi:hypothetical protein
MHGKYSTWKAAILKEPVSINAIPNGYFPHIKQSKATRLVYHKTTINP